MMVTMVLPVRRWTELNVLNSTSSILLVVTGFLVLVEIGV